MDWYVRGVDCSFAALLEGHVVPVPALLPPTPVLVVEVQNAASHLKIEKDLRVHCSLRSLVVSDCRSTVRELCRAIAYRRARP